MTLADFKIRQITFEIRYDDAYILWDVAGRLTRELTAIWPGLKVSEGKPNQQTLQGRGVHVQTGFTVSHVMIFLPKSVVQHVEPIASTFKVWTTFLEIKKLNRVGTRTIYVKKYDTEDAANQASADLGLVRLPEGPVLNYRSGPVQAGVSVRWRDDATTTLLSINSERRIFEIEATADFAEESRKVVKDELLIDVDRATKESVDLARFDVRQWLEGVQHVQSRDIPKFIGGE